MADAVKKRCSECGCLQGHTIDCPEFGLEVTSHEVDRRLLSQQRARRHQTLDDPLFDPLPVKEDDPMAMIYEAFDFVPRRITRIA